MCFLQLHRTCEGVGVEVSVLGARRVVGSRPGRHHAADAYFLSVTRDKHDHFLPRQNSGPAHPRPHPDRPAAVLGHRVLVPLPQPQTPRPIPPQPDQNQATQRGEAGLRPSWAGMGRAAPDRGGGVGGEGRRPAPAGRRLSDGGGAAEPGQSVTQPPAAAVTLLVPQPLAKPAVPLVDQEPAEPGLGPGQLQVSVLDRGVQNLSLQSDRIRERFSNACGTGRILSDVPCRHRADKWFCLS